MRKILKSQREDLKRIAHDNGLKLVQKKKYLDLQVNCLFDWKELTRAVSTKVSRAVGFLEHAISFLSKEKLQPLCTGIVELHFRYWCYVLGCIGRNEISQLQ